MVNCGAIHTYNGSPCQKPAGAGTAHKGTGYCFYHDKTAVIMNDGHRTMAFHLNSQQFRKRVQALASDPGILELDREIGFARVLLERVEHGSEELGDLARPVVFNMILSTIGKLVERKHKIEMERKGTIKVAFVVSLMDAWSKTLNELIPDPDLRQKIGTRVSAMVTQTIPVAALQEMSSESRN